MNHGIIFGALLLVSNFVWATPYEAAVVEETLYQQYKQNIQSPDKSMKLNGFSPFEQSLFVDAVWDLAEEGNTKALDILDEVNTFHYSLVEKLRMAILRIKYNREDKIPSDLMEELINALKTQDVEIKVVYTIAAYEKELLLAGHTELIELARKHPQYHDIIEDDSKRAEVGNNIVSDLFNETPDSTTYMNGEYVKSVKIFMLCRENRLYPCLMTMKDIHGQVVKNADGTIWTHKALASSARGLPSYSRNGNTPAGIFTIDSVMPVADAQMSFGKNRRMMLNFIPKSKNESLIKSLLPPSSHDDEWWKSTITARDIGRNLFRIHGTGKINVDPTTPYYPFMRTSGCIAQRENTYDGVTYNDQRELLDEIMVAMDLVPEFENELKVKGILYLIEIDDLNEPVSSRDLALRGIE